MNAEDLAKVLGRAVMQPLMDMLAKQNAVIQVGNSEIRFTGSGAGAGAPSTRAYVPRPDTGNAAILMGLKYRDPIDRRSALPKKDLISAANLFRSRSLTLSNSYVRAHVSSFCLVSLLDTFSRASMGGQECQSFLRLVMSIKLEIGS